MVQNAFDFYLTSKESVLTSLFIKIILGINRTEGEMRDNQIYTQQRGWPERHMGRAVVSTEMYKEIDRRLEIQVMKLVEIIRRLNHLRY